MKLAISAVFLLVLPSCSSTDHLADATQCDNDHKIPKVNSTGVVETKDGEAVMVVDKGFCDEEWEKYRISEDRKDARAEFKRLTLCPPGQVFVCKDRWCMQQGRRRSSSSNIELSRLETTWSRCYSARSVFH